MSRCRASLRMSVPLRVLALRTSCLYHFVYIYSQVYLRYIISTLVYDPQLSSSNLSVPLRVLKRRTSSDAYIYSQIYIYHISDTFVYEPMLCELTYVCSLAIASAHALKLFVYRHVFTGRYLCIWTQVVQTHICLCSCERSHLEPLCIHAYTHKYTSVIFHKYFCIRTDVMMLCKLTYACALTRAHAQNLLFVYIYIHKYTCIILLIMLAPD